MIVLSWIQICLIVSDQSRIRSPIAVTVRVIVMMAVILRHGRFFQTLTIKHPTCLSIQKCSLLTTRYSFATKKMCVLSFHLHQLLVKLLQQSQTFLNIILSNGISCFTSKWFMIYIIGGHFIKYRNIIQLEFMATLEWTTK